jgi:hypothetical protein
MRCVVYDPQDLEPLTVVDVPQVFIRELERGKRGPLLRFPIWEEVTFTIPNEPILNLLRTADVLMERFCRGEVWTWCASALNPEVCLLMRSDFLPGQRREVNRREREAFVSGLMTAFGME